MKKISALNHNKDSNHINKNIKFIQSINLGESPLLNQDGRFVQRFICGHTNGLLSHATGPCSLQLTFDLTGLLIDISDVSLQKPTERDPLQLKWLEPLKSAYNRAKEQQTKSS